MAKKITKYEARDGTLHSSMDAANQYENLLDLYVYLDENPIYCGTEYPVKGQDFGLWLKDQPRVFVMLLPDEHGSPTNLADARREAQRTVPKDVPETEGEADRNGDEGYFPDGG